DEYVDKEYPVTVKIVGEIAAQRMADGGSDHHCHAVKRECLAALFDWEGIGEDSLLAGRQAATPQSLQNTREDEQRQGVRPSAQKRADGKHGHASHVKERAA